MNGTKNLGIRRCGNDYYLDADCWNNCSNSFVHSDVRLDDCLGNNHGEDVTFFLLELHRHFTDVISGRFQWGGHDFSKCARNITLGIEGPQQLPVLHAELEDQGCYAARNVNLAEKINNRDGQLKISSHCC